VTPATNIPIPHDRFVGRKEEMRDVAEAIADHRIVTLVGPGGAGKTRLAIEAAADNLSLYPDGVWFTQLSTARIGADVAALTARTLALTEHVGQSPDVDVLTWLSEREVLLVLDNCEHLVDAVAALVTAVLDRCHMVRVLATSRELLRCRGEKALAVSSLPAGEQGRPGPATELFIDRALSAAPGLVLGAADVPVIEQVCGRLDGLPLAIELAAARLRTISLNQLAERLDVGFHLVSGGSRDAPARQRTIESVVAWSYDLLDANEQSMFRQLCAFPDDLPLAAVEAVTAPFGGETLDVLGSLVDKSLVIANRSGDEYRYQMLETIREYGHGLLVRTGEIDAARRRIVAWVVGLVARLEHDMRTPRQDAAIEPCSPSAPRLAPRTSGRSGPANSSLR
jgi:predicted ATPase